MEKPELIPFRIGQGYDVHRFGEPTSNAAIILGGVAIPFERPLLAHSDGDVLIHAICDALLGSCAMGDIGAHFPDTDPNFKGADSRALLRHVNFLINSEGYFVNNLDCTIVAQAPKMAGYIAEMRANIAADLSVTINQISVKATTTEKLGFVGRSEGIAAEAAVLVTHG